MTRINLVPPQELTGGHLVAEYRELPRVFKLAANWYKTRVETFKETSLNLPREYTLGKGHVRFFYNKLGFLAIRQMHLIIEMEVREFRPKFVNPGSLLDLAPYELHGDYIPTPEAIELNRNRIKERLSGKKD